MHARVSTCIGMSVVQETGGAVGTLEGILVDPDTGKIEAWQVGGLLLLTMDILRFGLQVVVRSGEVLVEGEDVVRLRSLLSDPRRVIGQRMLTKSGRRLGTCRDLQFHSQSWTVEWFFPRRFFRWGIPVPAAQILEVRPDAIIVRDDIVSEKEEGGVVVPEPAL
jgi:sporulation protein YlmC with PRC-barrel domain